jgi:hypothetical protein
LDRRNLTRRLRRDHEKDNALDRNFCLDINLEIECPDGHSILLITLTNKLFYQEVSELIYEKQAFNIFINDSDRLRGDRRLNDRTSRAG